MEKITLGLDSKLLEAARGQASRESTTLEAKLRRWVEEYASQAETPEQTQQRRRQQAKRALATIDYLSKKYSGAGRKFTREEMNER